MNLITMGWKLALAILITVGLTLWLSPLPESVIVVMFVVTMAIIVIVDALVRQFTR